MALLILPYIMSWTGANKCLQSTTPPLIALNLNSRWRSNWQLSQVARCKGWLRQFCLPLGAAVLRAPRTQTCWGGNVNRHPRLCCIPRLICCSASCPCSRGSSPPALQGASAETPSICTAPAHAHLCLSLLLSVVSSFYPLTSHSLTGEPAE